MVYAASGRRRSPPPTPSAAAPIIARPGGPGRRRNRRCAPISSPSACASAGSPPTRRRSPRSRPFASGCATKARGSCSSTTTQSTRPASGPTCRPAARRASLSPRTLTPGAASPPRLKSAGGPGKSAPTISSPALGATARPTQKRCRRRSAACRSRTSRRRPIASGSRCHLPEYRRRFDAAPARLLDDARHAPAEYHDGRTVAKTFALAIDEAAKLHPAAEPLIAHAAVLAAEPIPLFLFSEGGGEIRRAAGVAACGRWARRGGCRAARLRACRSQSDELPTSAFSQL